ncbi:hypothetical protein [Flavobacterium sp. HJ-32-4]|uniref:hypothetical protein n=1 Tax=Flavobacterium sp. HJ-32-4 TaxID=1160795 RepID=UPI001F12BFCD|nr:hypothetical protein [Flavobacterium sp. HJ-32-4]UMY65301.1 hypothetical protein MKO97_12425 [Flavobacterium sp. HJ-32-4]
MLVNGRWISTYSTSKANPKATIRDRKVKQPPLMRRGGYVPVVPTTPIYATIFNNSDKLPYEQEDLFRAGDMLFSLFRRRLFLQTVIPKRPQGGNLNIAYKKEIDFLLKYCLLEKAVYELGYELNSKTTLGSDSVNGNC